MASALSEEEFQRLQTQLLELKSNNYTLEEQNRRYHHENGQLKVKCEDLEKALSKAQIVAKINPLSIARNFANKVDSKLRETNDSKSQQSPSHGNEHMQQLVSDNDLLHRRIDSQEQEFRITNETLKAECALLLSAHESLELRIKHLEDENRLLEQQLKLFNCCSVEEHPQSQPECDLGINDPNLFNDPLEVNSVVLIKKDNSLPSSPSSSAAADCGIGSVDEEMNNRKRIDNQQTLSYTILKEKEKLEFKVNELEEIINDLRKENALISAQYDEMSDKCVKIDSFQHQLEDAQQLNSSQITIINDLRSQIDLNQQKYESEVQQLRDDSSVKMDLLNTQLQQSREEIEKLIIELNVANDELQQLSTVTKDNEKLSNELYSYKEELEFCKTHSEETHSRIESEHKQYIQQLNESHDRELTQLREECDNYQLTINQLEDEIKNLNQQIIDGIEERKIHEKKGVAMVKELKRQLNSERKRAEKLQERLQEFLNESTSTISAEIRKQAISVGGNNGNNNNNNGNDSSSVGSWSFMSAKDSNNRRTSSLHSGSDGREPTPPFSPINNQNQEYSNRSQVSGGMLEQENAELVSRVTSLQQEKWILEEKINHLEGSNSSMAEDILRKTQLIQYYCMEGRPDPPSAHSLTHGDAKITMKRVMDFIKDKGDENMREINRKVQRMLEETLTKNMHLQQNLETLSDEVMRLNKIIEAKDH